MDAERWQKIERIFHAALEVEADRRAAILVDSCRDDDTLRREVETLLAQYEKAGTFIETPVFATANSTLDAERVSSNPEHVAILTAGAMIAHYRVLQEIGAGGMGVVYKAQDSKLGRPVALKFLAKTPATETSGLERFQREARAASALNHPNICTIYEIEEYEGHPFIAMEYLEGRTLKDYMLGGPLDNDEICAVGVQIAEALSAAHSKGVVHRDVKPGNIFVTDTGPVKVLDFGLAKLVGSEDGSAPTKSLTESHTVTGTLPYMSPEQLRGREVDARTDIYALGVVLYEMATALRPFTAGVSPQLIDDILNSDPRPPRQLNPKIPPKLEEITLKCLEKNPEDRYQTAKEIAVDLRRMTIPSSASQRIAEAQSKWFANVPRFVWAVIPALALAILAVGWIMRTTSSSSIRSIAVLPLVEESKDESAQYIGDGITEGVIDKLSEIPSLKVMSRNSVFRFKGKQNDAESAGRDLHVQAVLTGRIALHAGAMTVSAELVNVKDGAQIWGHHFQYSMSDLSRVQDDLAAAVSDKLQFRMNSAEETRLIKRVTDNSEAYQLYLEARYHFNQRTASGIRKSIELFQQAAERDPSFALAYAGLADAYVISANMGFLAPRESSPEAKAAATKALVLDPQLGEAHSALGQVKSHYDFDLPGAYTEFTKGIKFNPNYAIGHLFYAGGYLTPMGRHSEAIAEMKKALELDPLSVPLNNLMGNTYMWAGDFNKAAQQFRSTVELDPTFPMTHFFYSASLEGIGKYEEAIAEKQKGELLVGVSVAEVEAEAREFREALQSGGPKSYWQKTLEVTLKKYQQAGSQYFPALAVAAAYAKVGDKQKAMEWLEKSYTERDGNLTLVNCLPYFKGLHGDPGFAELLRRMGLPQ